MLLFDMGVEGWVAEVGFVTKFALVVPPVYIVLRPSLAFSSLL